MRLSYQVVDLHHLSLCVGFQSICPIPIKREAGDKITEEEIRLALEAGARAGVIEEAEQDMVENIFRLGDRRVGVLMLPRIDIAWLDVSDSMETIREKIVATTHHRFPVCDGDSDKVVGIADARYLLSYALANKTIDLKKVVSSPQFVQEINGFSS